MYNICIYTSRYIYRPLQRPTPSIYQTRESTNERHTYEARLSWYLMTYVRYSACMQYNHTVQILLLLIIISPSRPASTHAGHTWHHSPNRSCKTSSVARCRCRHTDVPTTGGGWSRFTSASIPSPGSDSLSIIQTTAGGLLAGSPSSSMAHWAYPSFWLLPITTPLSTNNDSDFLHRFPAGWALVVRGCLVQRGPQMRAASGSATGWG
jgi:hypothetical protein